MNIFNILLYFGIFFIVGGFSLFLYSEMRIREIDIQLFKLEQKIKKELSKWNIVKDRSAILTTHRTGNEDLKEIKKIKPEEEVVSIMEMEISAH